MQTKPQLKRNYKEVVYLKIKGKQEIKIIDGDFVYFLNAKNNRETIHLIDCKKGDLIGVIDVENIDYIYELKEKLEDLAKGE